MASTMRVKRTFQTMNIEPTALIAIYAAVVSTSALALNFRTWFESKPRLHLSLMVDGMIVGTGVEEKDLTILTVTNRGRSPTMITDTSSSRLVGGGSG